MNELHKCYLFLQAISKAVDTDFNHRDYERIMFKCFQNVFFESTELYENRKVRIIQSGETGTIMSLCYCGVPSSVKLIVTRSGYKTGMTVDIRNLELL